MKTKNEKLFHAGRSPGEERIRNGREHEWSFWGKVINVLFLNLGAGYTEMLGLWKYLAVYF